MKQAVKKNPIAHIYAFAAVWVIWGIFLPMYALWHFGILIVISVVAGFIFAKLLPGKTVYITVPDPEPEPFVSGNSEVDSLVSQGDTAIKEMQRLRDAIEKESIKVKVDEIIQVSRKIIDNLKEDSSHLPGVKRFFNYYLPTTIKLLNAYDRMYDQGISGTNISGTMDRIETVLDTMIDAYNKQLDSLFAGQAMDIETDIEVIEGMLKREGLTGSDFSAPKGDNKNNNE